MSIRFVDVLPIINFRQKCLTYSRFSRMSGKNNNLYRCVCVVEYQQQSGSLDSSRKKRRELFNNIYICACDTLLRHTISQYIVVGCFVAKAMNQQQLGYAEILHSIIISLLNGIIFGGAHTFALCAFFSFARSAESLIVGLVSWRTLHNDTSVYTNHPAAVHTQPPGI